MADKDSGKRPFNALTRASLSVRYSRLINEQADSRANPVSPVSNPSASASALTHVGSPAPRLRTVVEPSSAPNMKGLLGLYQDRIRMFQSPPWLVQEQRAVLETKPGNTRRKALIEAGNFVLDLCRLVETLLNKTNQNGSRQVGNEAVQKLERKLADIWCDFYLAVESLRDDGKRSGALVRHAGVGLADLLADFGDEAFHSALLRQELRSGLEILSVNVAQADTLLSRIPARTKKSNETLKESRTPGLSVAGKTDRHKQIQSSDGPSHPYTGLPHEIAVIREAVTELARKLDESAAGQQDIIRMFGLCAARLAGILSSPYSLKKWELELYRAHHIFRQAAGQLPSARKAADPSMASSAANLPYDRMADYISSRFEDTIDHVMRNSDSAYARHNFTIRKQNVQIVPGGVLRSPSSRPILQTLTPAQARHDQRAALAGTMQEPNPMRQATAISKLTRSGTLQPTKASLDVERADPDASSKMGNDALDAQRTDRSTKGHGAEPKSSTQDGRTRRQSAARAVTMNMHWQELEAISSQKLQNKQDV